jgi:hypothetical protein
LEKGTDLKNWKVPPVTSHEKAAPARAMPAAEDRPNRRREVS